MDKDFFESVLAECDKYIDAESKLKSRQRVNQLEKIRCARALSRKEEVGSKHFAAEDRSIHLKCVLVGDGGIGKSSLTQAFVFGQFSSQYIPTVYDEYIVNKMVMSDRNEDGSSSCARARENVFKVSLLIGDTGGQTELDRLRPVCYQNTNVILICFSVVVPSSFLSVTSKWVTELKRHTTKYKQLAILLIGTQSDLRSNWNVLLNLSKQGLRPIAETEALRLAKKIGATTYIECSAFTMKNVGEVFDKTLKLHRVMETNFNLKKVKFVGFCQPVRSEILTHISTESCVVDIKVDDEPQQTKSLEVAKERSLDTNSNLAAVTHCSNSKNKTKSVNNRCFPRTRYSIGPSMRLRTKSSKLKRLILFKCLFRQSNHGFHIDYAE